MDKILDGKKFADQLNSELKIKIEYAVNMTGVKPKLAAVLVGEDPASKIYVNIKHKTCLNVGIDSLKVDLAENITRDELLNLIRKLNEDKSIHHRRSSGKQQARGHRERAWHRGPGQGL